jgi:hypothetical protein
MGKGFINQLSRRFTALPLPESGQNSWTLPCKKPAALLISQNIKVEQVVLP